MSEKAPDFHERALNSSLFKGRYDWYFCYVKSEKIAHALGVIAGQSPSPVLVDVVHASALVPQTVAYAAAGETTPEALLADLFGLMSLLRIHATLGHLNRDNALILVGEYEKIVNRITSGIRPSPFLSSRDFLIPEMHTPPQEPLGAHLQSLTFSHSGDSVKDTHKRQVGIKDIKDINKDSRQGDRVSQILKLVKEKRSVSIKDISSVVQGCSEKTIQRELAGLIEQGLVRKVGERRWSTYVPA